MLATLDHNENVDRAHAFKKQLGPNGEQEKKYHLLYSKATKSTKVRRVLEEKTYLHLQEGNLRQHFDASPSIGFRSNVG